MSSKHYILGKYLPDYISNNPGHPRSPAEKAANKAAKKARRADRLRASGRMSLVEAVEAQAELNNRLAKQRQTCIMCVWLMTKYRPSIGFNLPV